MKVLVAQSCLTLFDHMDYSRPGSSVHGILQARILNWVAIPFNRGGSPADFRPKSLVLQLPPLGLPGMGRWTPGTNEVGGGAVRPVTLLRVHRAAALNSPSGQPEPHLQGRPPGTAWAAGQGLA